MNTWAIVYRTLGGVGPNDRPRRWPFADWTWLGLRSVGLLKRDPALECEGKNLGGYIINWRWQWRFWRGPYGDCFRHFQECEKPTCKRHRLPHSPRWRDGW